MSSAGPHFSIPSQSPRSQPPARRWLPDSILACKKRNSLPSRSQMIKNVSGTFFSVFFVVVTNSCDSHLVLLQVTRSLRSRNGRVSTPLKSTHSGPRELTNFDSSINAPTTGNNYAAFQAAAKAIGANEVTVRFTVCCRLRGPLMSCVICRFPTMAR